MSYGASVVDQWMIQGPGLRRSRFRGLEKTGAPVLPSPGLLGHHRELRDDPLGLFWRARNEKGDLVQFRVGPVAVHLLSDPAATYSVLVERHKKYSKRTPGYDLLRLVLGDGLVTSEGELWRRQRRIAQPAFRRDSIRQLTEVMRTAADDLVSSWSRLGEDGRVIDLSQAMSEVTLRIAGETLFGVDLTRDSDAIGTSLAGVMDHFTHAMGVPLPALVTLPTRRNLRARRDIHHLDRVVREIIAKSQGQTDGPATLLQMFMEARDEDGKGMTDKQLRDEVLTMLLAGHETTANALTWTLYALSTHPTVASRVAEEVATLGGDPPTMEQAKSLTYTTQVLKEAMRLYPPVWALGRRADAGDEILGYDVPEGALVIMSQYLLHRHPDHWDNPEGFDPDRFANGRSAPTKGSYLPFSVGPRKCIGEHFAMVEAVILLATMMQRFEFELMPGFRFDPEPSVTLRARHGMPMRIRPRPAAAGHRT